MRKDSNILDRTDIKILEILQKDARISNIDLANKINLSPTPCMERVRKLEKQGYIKEYVAHLNPDKLDASLLAYIEISLENTTTSDLADFNQTMLAMDEVLECNMVAGGFDYLIKIRTSDMQGYRRFLGEKLAAIKGISQTHTYVVMEEVKSTHVLPVKQKTG